LVLSQQAYIFYGISKWGKGQAFYLFLEDFNLSHYSNYYLKLTSEREREREKERKKEREREREAKKYIIKFLANYIQIKVFLNNTYN